MYGGGEGKGGGGGEGGGGEGGEKEEAVAEGEVATELCHGTAFRPGTCTAEAGTSV